MRKKGMLLASETLKMIIALICISFLIYFLGAMYFSKVESSEKVNANALIDRIKEIVASGNFDSVEIGEVSPAGWIIFSFTEEDSVIPNQCAGESCLCVCDEVFVDVGDRQIGECDDNGVCVKIGKLMELPDIKIKGGGEFTTIEVYKSGEFVGIREK